ncbi:HtaA domain-containing protein [Solirubrobacter sp. CPCC 204708]|uniref:HtaA domain-containing protein n=1 Tax=Solirubrobacter deserti TaxID=2282478 RepID=A0ABT4RIZ7_9ACTN|nr:HtaA domain-containing protein [Solirubrobacter deserti]MBE2320884.1 HtaA domain-containing protein [Solirubrobacter deserti]MDA0138519.1 HtaA domain-containing protein [Solirubrobacter deserti]
MEGTGRPRWGAALALAVLAVLLSSPQASAEPVTFGGGTVDWGFANRWRCYVVGNVARGQIEVSGGVEKVAGTPATGPLCTGRNAGSEVLRFPIRGGSYDAGKLSLSLRGTVRFWGHDHHRPGNTTPQLDTRFTNLRIVAEGATGTLMADTTGATLENPTPITRTNVPVVRIDLTARDATPIDGGLGWSTLPTALTAEGAQVFGSYPEGEPFDPLTIAARFGTPQTDPDSADPAPTPTPTPSTPAAPAPTPEPAAARVATVAAGKPRLSSRRVATLATVACPAGAAAGCSVRVPKTLRLTIAGKRYAATLSTKTRLGAGRAGTVKLKLGSAAAKRLRGRSTKVKLEVTTTIAGKATSSTVTVTLQGRTR